MKCIQHLPSGNYDRVTDESAELAVASGHARYAGKIEWKKATRPNGYEIGGAQAKAESALQKKRRLRVKTKKARDGKRKTA